MKLITMTNVSVDGVMQGNLQPVTGKNQRGRCREHFGARFGGKATHSSAGFREQIVGGGSQPTMSRIALVFFVPILRDFELGQRKGRRDQGESQLFSQ